MLETNNVLLFWKYLLQKTNTHIKPNLEMITKKLYLQNEQIYLVHVTEELYLLSIYNHNNIISTVHLTLIERAS